MQRASGARAARAGGLACSLMLSVLGCGKTANGAASSAGSSEAGGGARAPSAGAESSSNTINGRSGNAGGSSQPSASNGGKGSAAAKPTAGDSGGAKDGGQAPNGAASAAGSGGQTSDDTQSASDAADTWRMMGYDARNWYLNPAEKTISVENAAQLAEKWRFTVSGFPIGSPVIAEGKVFAMAQGGVYAIDLETGQQLWYREDLVGSASVAYRDGFIYVHHSTPPPALYKLKASDGSTVWGPVKNCRDDTSCSGESSPILAGNTVLVGMENNMAEASFNDSDTDGARGGVRALDTETGDVRWLYDTIPEGSTETGASVWSTVSVDMASGTVFATTGNSYKVAGPNSDAFHAIDLASGMRRWVTQVRQGDTFTVPLSFSVDNTKFDFDFGANPILADVGGQKLVAAGDKGGAFWALDRDTGAIAWNRDDLSPSHDATYGGIFINGAFDGKAFYVVSNDPSSNGGVLHRLDAMTGTTTWMHTFKDSTWGAQSLANGVLFVPSNSTVFVMNAETGDVVAQLETGGTIAGGSPAIAQGRVVVKSGFLYKDPVTKANDQIICYALPSVPPAAGSGGMGAPPPPPAAGASAGASAGAGATPNPTSFSAIYQDIFFNLGCGSGQCHSAVASGGLNMTSRDMAYTNLVGVIAMGMAQPGTAANGCGGTGMIRVVPGDPNSSLLVAKLAHTQTCGGPMPNAGTTLPADQLQRIRDWISAGAPND